MSSDSGTGRSDQARSGGPFQRIPAATDFSQAAGSALDYAHALAKQFQAKLYLVHTDRVVVGTHGRTSNKKLALGSVGEEIFGMGRLRGPNGGAAGEGCERRDGRVSEASLCHKL